MMKNLFIFIIVCIVLSSSAFADTKSYLESVIVHDYDIENYVTGGNLTDRQSGHNWFEFDCDTSVYANATETYGGISQSLYFNNATDKCRLDNANFMAENVPASVFICKKTVVDGSERYFGGGRDNVGRWWQADDYFWCNNQFATATAYDASQWNCIVTTHLGAGSTFTMYVNSSAASSNNADAYVWDGETEFFIGGTLPTEWVWIGNIIVFQTFNVTLNTTQ